MSETRTVNLRAEHIGEDDRYLRAYLDDEGNLHIDGQDLGPGTSIVSTDGEYEWFYTYAAINVPRVIVLLGGKPGDDVLDVVGRWTGERSYELESLLRNSDIPREQFVWSG